MTDAEMEELGKQMWDLWRAPTTDPVMKALAHLVWSQIQNLKAEPDNAKLRELMMRSLGDVRDAIIDRRRANIKAVE